ncbi:Uncharacterised protein [uncultured archaeon]|nr:Uncharacterised protein [uncultured archaeon]
MQPQDTLSKEEIRARILLKLSRKRIWGNKHTELVHVRSGLPKGFEKKAEEAARELRDEGFLTWLPKTGEIHISLNPARKKEIEQMIEKCRWKQIW